VRLHRVLQIVTSSRGVRHTVKYLRKWGSVDLNLHQNEGASLPPLALISTANEDSVVGSYYPLRVGCGVLLGLVKAEEHTERVVELLAGASPESGRILARGEA